MFPTSRTLPPLAQTSSPFLISAGGYSLDLSGRAVISLLLFNVSAAARRLPRLVDACTVYRYHAGYGRFRCWATRTFLHLYAAAANVAYCRWRTHYLPLCASMLRWAAQKKRCAYLPLPA